MSAGALLNASNATCSEGNARATASRTTADTLTLRSRAQATSAAFKPRISTVTKS
jgi:hypothetical protein